MSGDLETCRNMICTHGRCVGESCLVEVSLAQRLDHSYFRKPLQLTGVIQLKAMDVVLGL